MNIKELIKLPATKLKRIVQLKAHIERLENQLGSLLGVATPTPVKRSVKTKTRRHMSAAARRKIAAAAKRRWAKAKAAGKKHL